MKILDTTLRDGSYAIDFSFSKEKTCEVSLVLEDAGIELIEIGHGLGLSASEKTKFKAIATDEEYAQSVSGKLKKSMWGMFCIPGIASLDDLDMCAHHGMDFVRVGVSVENILEGKPFVEKAKKLGMFVAVNFMKSHVAPPQAFSGYVSMTEGFGADVAYLVDSAGSMLPEDIKAYFEAVRQKTDMPLAFHGHENMGFSTANAYMALQCGASIVDTSLQGMGRSSGNTPTENFVALLYKKGIHNTYDLIKILDASESLIRPYIKETGISSVDLICGYAGFHSSYLEKLQEVAERFGIDQRLLIIETCKEDQLEAPLELLERKAAEISRGNFSVAA